MRGHFGDTNLNHDIFMLYRVDLKMFYSPQGFHLCVVRWTLPVLTPPPSWSDGQDKETSLQLVNSTAFYPRDVARKPRGDVNDIQPPTQTQTRAALVVVKLLQHTFRAACACPSWFLLLLMKHPARLLFFCHRAPL